MPRLHFSALLLVVAAVWAAALMLQGVAVAPEFFGPFSLAVGVGVALMSAFDLWLWRVPVLAGWFVKRPKLWGTWRVVIQSSWVDRATNERVGPIEAYMTVRQTYSRVSMRLMTAESTSQLLVDDLVLAPDGQFRVYAVYQNEPKMAVRERSPLHLGALALSIHGSPAISMEGVYWTDRLTRGDMRLEERRNLYCDSFDEARGEYRGSSR